MGVIMKGGPSGNRQDYLASLSGTANQPVLTTETSGAVPSSIVLESENKRGTHPFDQGTPDFMPTGATIPESSTDVSDPDA